VARAVHDDALILTSKLPEVWAADLRPYVGGLIDQAMPGRQLNYAVSITPDNYLWVQVTGLTIATRSFFSSGLPEDPDNVSTEEAEDLQPYEVSSRILQTFADAGLDPQQVR